MKQLSIICAVLLGTAWTSTAQAGPFLQRFRFQLAGPIQIPAFPPFFPGGTITLQPPNNNSDPNSPAPGVSIDSAVKKGAADLLSAVTDAGLLTKTNGIPIISADLTGRTTAIAPIKSGTSSSGGGGGKTKPKGFDD